MSILDQYHEQKGLFDKLSQKVEAILTEALEEEKIEFLSITDRVKTKESISKKIAKKSYSNISEITDVVGLRIITYVESEIPKVEKIINDCFNIHTDDSIDKSKSLKTNEVGYRSVHFICDLGENRKEQSEYRKICDIPFEIQVRTVLQHGWAEIEHDRNYKFSGELPDQFKRRFYILAGALELMDREFDSLSQDIAKYAEEEKIKITHNELDIEINTITIDEYLINRFPKNNFKMNTEKNVIQEMQLFGLESIKDFDKLVTKHLKGRRELFFIGDENTSTGVIRNILMLEDIHRYFKIFDNSWTGTSRNSSTYFLLKEKYADLDSIYNQYGVAVYNS